MACTDDLTTSTTTVHPRKAEIVWRAQRLHELIGGLDSPGTLDYYREAGLDPAEAERLLETTTQYLALHAAGTSMVPPARFAAPGAVQVLGWPGLILHINWTVLSARLGLSTLGSLAVAAGGPGCAHETTDLLRAAFGTEVGSGTTTGRL